ncbi:hypothetical protein M529_11500 [Sphingobium ummariense RL-3]|uniref:Uncharacterized protein n=1 Tax=Sphingobium ummariense RL-3 TaxID=1346791 RepID=T0J2C6_9SPHN|nr:hypothetical protein [Sphingobium ummariense]EQB32106.1 hypothetical protein M529_11500 [Sphingobium ummariense RL-3]
MSVRERLLPVLVLAMLAGCSPSKGGQQTEREPRAGAREAPLPPATDIPAVAEAPALKPPPPDPKPATTVQDLPPTDLATATTAPYPPPVLQQPAEGESESYQPMDLPPSDAAASAEAFPDEVTAFMVERDSCDHFRGEEPYDADRRAYIEESIAELCTGTDAKLATLRRRYAANPAVTRALSGYEERIEKPRDSGASSPLYAPFLSQ